MGCSSRSELYRPDDLNARLNAAQAVSREGWRLGPARAVGPIPVRIPPEINVRRNLQPSEPRSSCLSGQAAPSPARPVSLETALREARAANARLPLPALDIEHREREGEGGPRRDVAEGRPRGRLRLRAPRLRGAPDEPRRRAAPGGRPAADLRGRIAQGGRRARGSRRRGRARAATGWSRWTSSSRSGAASASSSRSTPRSRSGARGSTSSRPYRSSLRSRQAAGQGVAADLLKTEVRVGARGGGARRQPSSGATMHACR